MDQKLRVHLTQTANGIIFESIDDTFVCISFMDVWWHQSEGNIVGVNKIIKLFRFLVVEALDTWEE